MTTKRFYVARSPPSFAAAIIAAIPTHAIGAWPAHACICIADAVANVLQRLLQDVRTVFQPPVVQLRPSPLT